jgi:hypothetical protein
MNEIEAKEIVERELTQYRRRSYSELLSLVDRSVTVERQSPSGVTYQVEVQVSFDDEAHRNLRVMGAIDDGGWRALKPTCGDFIVAPDGTFVGE